VSWVDDVKAIARSVVVDASAAWEYRVLTSAHTTEAHTYSAWAAIQVFQNPGLTSGERDIDGFVRMAERLVVRVPDTYAVLGYGSQLKAPDGTIWSVEGLLGGAGPTGSVRYNLARELPQKTVRE
jgi:hypothetical protein